VPWAIFSQKHLVTLTFDERVTFVESVLTKGPGLGQTVLVPDILQGSVDAEVNGR
jgi:hypothetical protein